AARQRDELQLGGRSTVANELHFDRTVALQDDLERFVAQQVVREAQRDLAGRVAVRVDDEALRTGGRTGDGEPALGVGLRVPGDVVVEVLGQADVHEGTGDRLAGGVADDA